MNAATELRGVLDPSLRFGLIDAETAGRVTRDVQQNRTDPIQSICLHGRVPPASVYQAVAAERGLDFVGAERLALQPDLLSQVPRAIVRRKRLLPLWEDEAGVLVATSDFQVIDDERLKESLRHAFGKPVRFAMAAPDDLAPWLRKAGDEPASETAAAPAAGEAVAFLADIIREAYVHRASDIHIECGERGARLRFRVDGELRIFREDVPPALALSVLSRLKVLAQMDIAKSREPQDGSFTYALEGAGGRRFDIRIATAPMQHGERATLRLLGADTRDLSLDDLGFSPAMSARFRALIRRPSGLILLTGPTGSGKTTTLYAALREIDRVRLNVMTVEDPVEYFIPGVSQMEVDNVGKVTVASALRSLLRHDPDVLMIGEIRDKETADLALRAATTGHLVLSTLHTNTAVGAVTRLVDMGCEPYLVAATLSAVVSQRLVRRLCPACKSPRPAAPDERTFLQRTDAATVYEPRGCLRCQRTGYLGRLAVVEMFVVDEAVREAISAGRNERAIAQAAKSLVVLRQDAAAKVLDGLTPLGEAFDVVILEDS
jgi:type II secretory ATPase GspE/PulE/Tfp pilus assembly ATPase PilB-like protein